MEPSYLLGSVHGVLAGSVGAVWLLLAFASITSGSAWALAGTAIGALALAVLWAEIRRLCHRERLWSLCAGGVRHAAGISPAAEARTGSRQADFPSEGRCAADRLH